MSDSSLGDLTISVGVDLSGLASQLDTAVEQVHQAAQSMADAFNNVSIGSIGEQLDKVAEAAEKAKPALDNFGDSIKNTGNSSHESESALGSLAESFEFLKTGVEAFLALAIVEKFRELGAEALEAYGEVEQFTTAMTLFTGSSEKAEEALKGVEEIAKKEPFKFPDLLNAAQKLSAFGFEADKLQETLQAAGNAAAATGNNFNSVANALGRVQLSGQVSARQLVQLGLSWQDIAKSMGVSIDEAQERLKKGQQEAAADVDALVKAINDKFSGAAEAMGKTFLGQFELLKNNLHGLFANIGTELAPSAGEALKIVNDIIDALKDIHIPQGFKDFVNDLKTFVEYGAIVVGTLTGLTAAVAALEPVIVGVTAAFLALQTEGLLGGLNAVGTGIINVATQLGLLQDVATMAATTMGVLQLSLAGLGAAFIGFELGKWLHDNVALIGQLGDKLGQFVADVANVDSVVADSTNQLQQQTSKLEASLSKQGITLDRGTMSLQQYNLALNQLARSSGAAGAALAADELSKKVADTVVAFENQQQALTKSREQLDFMTQAEKAGIASKGQVKEAQEALNAAQRAYDPEGFAAKERAVAEAHQRAAEAAKAHAEEIQNTAKAMYGIDTLLEGAAHSFSELSNQMLVAAQPASQIEKQIEQMRNAILDAYVHWNSLSAAQKQSVNDLAAIIQKYQEWDELQKDIALNDVLTSIGDKAKPTFDLVKAGLDSISQAVKDAKDYTKQLDDEYRQFGITVKGADIDTTLTHFDDLLARGNLSTDELNTAWASLASKFKDSAGYQQQVLDKMIAATRPMGDILAQQEKVLELKQREVEAWDQSGVEAAKIQLQIEKNRLATFAWHQETSGLADAIKGMSNAFAQAWDGISKAIANAIVNGQSFGEAMKTIFKTLETALIQLAAKWAMNYVAAALLQSLFPTLAAAATGASTAVATSMAASAASMSASAATMATAMSGAAAAVTAASGTAGGAMAGFAATTTTSMTTASTAVTAAGTSMIAVFGAVASVIGAIAGIFSAIELAHTNTLLSRIEESTRKTWIITGEQSDSIWNSSKNTMLYCQGMQDRLTDIEDTCFPQLKDVINAQMDTANGHLKSIIDELAEIQASGIRGGSSGDGSGASSSDIHSLIVAMNDGFAGQAGLLGEILNAIGSMSADSSGMAQVIVGAGGEANYVPGVGSGMSSSVAPDTTTSAQTNSNTTTVVNQMDQTVRTMLMSIEDRFSPDQWAYHLQSAATMMGVSLQGWNLNNLPDLRPGHLGTQAPSSTLPSVSVTVINQGTVVGSNGMRELAQAVQGVTISTLRGAGLNI